MSATCEYGTARSTRLKEIIDTGAKTGTSAGAKDKLMVGFTPYFTAGIWTNYNGASDDEHPNHLRLWDDIMISIHNDPRIVSDKYYKSFSTDGLQIYEYCTESGLLATDACRAEGTARTGYYSEGVPGYYCDRHYFE